MMKEYRVQNTKIGRSHPKVRNIKYSDLYILAPLFLFLLTASCHAQKTPKPYYEDLSSLRPKVNIEVTKSKDTIPTRQPITMVTPQHTVNAKVNTILDSIDRFNLTRKFVDGFTIQIYSGQKREEALNASKRLAESLAYLKANTQYQQPKFRVTVGKYFSRLEAQKDLLRLKRVFSSAILVPERIMIK